MEPETNEDYLARVKTEIELSAKVWQHAITEASQIAGKSSHNINVVDLAQRILDEARRGI